MTPLLVPPRGLGAPQMLSLPGMLPQPSGMMPMPPGQFGAVPPVPPPQIPGSVPPGSVPPVSLPAPQQLPGSVPPSSLAQHVPGTMSHVSQQPDQRPRLPTPPSMPMPEQMRDKGIRETPPGREYTPPVRSEVPAQLSEAQHYSPSHDTPPPPPPRPGRTEQRPLDPRDQPPHDPRRGGDPREAEFRGYNRESSYQQPEYDQMPRDPRKARDIPPPPPPRNGSMR